MTVQRFRKKPVEVEAVQWTGDNLAELQEFVGLLDLHCQGFRSNWKDRKEGLPAHVYNKMEHCWVNVPVGHWIIKGVRGEFYPCDPGVMAETYDEVSAEQGAS